MTDIVTQVIKFDNGEMDSVAEYIEFGLALIDSGLVNSTGTYQRFVRDLVHSGYILPTGALTPKGQAVLSPIDAP